MENENKNLFQKIGGAEGVIIIVFVLFSIFALTKPFISKHWGVKEIGHFYEAPMPYTTKYYVYLFEENNKAKNYKLTADITVDRESDGDLGWTTINLEKVYFSNGGFLYFENCFLEGKKDIADQCDDQNGVNWTVEFKKEKAE
jgi:hypothetical protein